MTRHDPLSALADDRTRGLALALALAALALLGAVTAVGTTAAQTDPTVRVDGGTTGVNETTTVDVVLTSAPNGLSGYRLNVSVADGGVARIESANYSDRLGLTSDPTIGSNGSVVSLYAVDVGRSVEPGASNVTLATVEIAGVEPGETRLTLEPGPFEGDNNGTAFQPAVQNATLTVNGDGAASGSSGSGDGEDAPSGSNDSDNANSSGEGDTATATVTPTVTPGEETATASATETATETGAAQETATTEAAAAAGTATASATAGGNTNTTETTTPLSPLVALAALAAGTLAFVGRHRRR